ncbi:hypothetical protein GCM10023328_19430 [Modestobacter marinus]|uniref:Fibronectin type-III domain-containing protein n=1 Tax=Modestobacter marinus TaxID=477641 RepID=A0A846LHI5_9ACTN|nr:fibronectin type III domain-containing protein [Modestobacter marinus]NIH67603.1 hypothetical protein [Modestobacter marinus]GGL72821.1 hypothetical protein GCM10011589_31380 [Modestobacter marinus]
MFALHLSRRSMAALAVSLVAVIAAPEAVPGAAAARAETTTAAATQVTWVPSAARPFSDPVWLPLREPARVSCTYTNCPGPYHGYWALDLLGDQGDPIHAAGAGIFHIGSLDTSCRTSTAEAAGTWVWIDHGGGVVTKYTHLDTVTAREGQLVTPSTRIGTMGHSGDVLPCTTNYLHFEVRTGGIKGKRVDPGPLWGCEGTTRRAFPTVWGHASWNDIPKVTRSTPALDNGCLPTSTVTSSEPAAVAVRRGDRTARVAWTPPASRAVAVDRYVISQELWGPSFQGWHPATYRSVPAGQLATNFRGLDNGRRYRYRVLSHTSVGNSAWTRFVEAVPATVPVAPGTDRQLTAGRSYVRFGWWNGTAQGAPITSYTAAIRRQKATGWTAWSYVTVPGNVRTYRWDGLRPGTTYQVTVRADSDVGPSRWGRFRALTTTP